MPAAHPLVPELDRGQGGVRRRGARAVGRDGVAAARRGPRPGAGAAAVAAAPAAALAVAAPMAVAAAEPAAPAPVAAPVVAAAAAAESRAPPITWTSRTSRGSVPPTARSSPRSGSRRPTTCSRPARSPTTARRSPRRPGSAATLIREWVDKVDLMRVPGVGPQYSDLLEAAGVDSPAELAQRNPANLAITVQEVVAARPGIVRRPPERGGGRGLDRGGGQARQGRRALTRKVELPQA